METKRLDKIVAEKAAVSREYAKNLINTGCVSLSDRVLTKPGAMFDDDEDIIVAAAEMKYVGRGGYKLEAALDHFNIDVAGLVCGDIGASTGGFTDCMLQRGASKVYAIDAGTAQLVQKLRDDARVVSMENTNVRNLFELPEKLDFITIDVSFISVTKIIENVSALIRDGGKVVCLIKPQFEVGRKNLNKKGIVKDNKQRDLAVKTVLTAFENSRPVLKLPHTICLSLFPLMIFRKKHEKSLPVKTRQKLVRQKFGFQDRPIGYKTKGVISSPILGGDGNVEFLAYLSFSGIGE